MYGVPRTPVWCPPNSPELGGQRGLLGAIAPQGYQAPPLRWFRGLDLQATMVRESLSAHAEIIMQMP